MLSVYIYIYFFEWSGKGDSKLSLSFGECDLSTNNTDVATHVMKFYQLETLPMTPVIIGYAN